jgi:hypothetical protein
LIFYRYSTEEALLSDFRQVLGEPITFILDLMSEFPSIAQNEHRIGDGFVIELMQHRENKNCGLSSS